MGDRSNHRATLRSGGMALPGVSDLLCQGGDDRIRLKNDGANSYGFSPSAIGLDVLEFSASTSSTVSHRAFEHIETIWRGLVDQLSSRPADEVYAEHVRSLRVRLLDALGLMGQGAERPEVILSPSGTDAHQIAAQLHAISEARPTTLIMMDPAETGSGVRDAMARGAPDARIETIGLRHADTTLRTAEAVEADVEARLVQAVRQGRRVLLVAVLGSKTGLIAPRLDRLAALSRRYPLDLTVLIDACQMRTDPSVLAYALREGFLVCITGSKFLTGPAFSAALLISVDRAARWKQDVRYGLGVASSLRQDWPGGWATGQLDSGANFGLLLRWEAALSELAAFQNLDPFWRAAFYAELAQAVQTALAQSSILSPVDIRLDRPSLPDLKDAWDRSPTVFPFCIRAPLGGAHDYMSLEALKALHGQLMRVLPDGRAGVRLGQPVVCGQDAHGPIGALRLAASARLAVAASLFGARSVIGAAVDALRRVEALALAGRVAPDRGDGVAS